MPWPGLGGLMLWLGLGGLMPWPGLGGLMLWLGLGGLMPWLGLLWLGPAPQRDDVRALGHVSAYEPAPRRGQQCFAPSGPASYARYQRECRVAGAFSH
jgi:hypothetical protein